MDAWFVVCKTRCLVGKERRVVDSDRGVDQDDGREGAVDAAGVDAGRRRVKLPAGDAGETHAGQLTSNGSMNTAVASHAAPVPWQLWTGRVLSALPVLMLFLSASMKLSHAAGFVEQWVKFGYPENTATPLGIVELSCAVLYAVPKTRVLGAILLTGYLGGAVATHVRVGDVFFMPLVLGIIAWAGLFLRDARLRELLPLVRDR